MPPNGNSWNDDMPILTACYEDDTLESAFAESCRRLPHRTPNTISNRACTTGLAKARLARIGPRVQRAHHRITPEERAKRTADRIAERQREKAANAVERAKNRADTKAQRECDKVEAKAQRVRERATARANSKRSRVAARAKALRIEKATKAADVAQRAVAEADRLAREAGIAPRIVVGSAASAPARTSTYIAPQSAGTVERDYVRRRLIHTIDSLSAELRVPVASVIESARAIAADGFPRTALTSHAEIADMVLSSAMKDSI